MIHKMIISGESSTNNLKLSDLKDDEEMAGVKFWNEKLFDLKSGKF